MSLSSEINLIKGWKKIVIIWKYQEGIFKLTGKKDSGGKYTMYIIHFIIDGHREWFIFILWKTTSLRVVYRKGKRLYDLINYEIILIIGVLV